MGGRLAFIVLLAVGCGDDDGGGGDAAPADSAPIGDTAPSGHVCNIGTDAGLETIVATPALDCQSRTCLHVAGTMPDLCTSECDDASDCVEDPLTPCTSGFMCIDIVTTGPFMGRLFCACNDYL